MLQRGSMAAMKLHIDNGLMYCDGLLFCRVEAGNGRSRIPLGVSGVEVRTATEHGGVPMAWTDSHGWIGGLAGCDIVVGRVLGRNGVIPCLSFQHRITSLVERATDNGRRVTLEVQG